MLAFEPFRIHPLAFVGGEVRRHGHCGPALVEALRSPVAAPDDFRNLPTCHGAAVGHLHWSEAGLAAAGVIGAGLLLTGRRRRPARATSS